MDPAGVIWGQTSGWDEAVDMRVSEQVLAPGMQDGEESDLGAQVLGIGGYLEKRFRTGAEQEVIEDLFILQHQLTELMRQGEDNVDIGDRQEFILASGDPVVASSALTLGTVPIAATIKRDGAIAAARA
jgi:hypothetical protein